MDNDNLTVVADQEIIDSRSLVADQDNMNLLVTSNELILDTQWPPLTINEQRLVIYMLSLIKKTDIDFKPLKFSIRDLDKMFGGNRKDLYKEFDAATDGLMKKIIRWREPENKRVELKATWCSSAKVVKGQGVVSLRFDPELKPFLLALKGNFTTWGEARAVIGLKNHYSLRIYQFLKYNQGMAALDGRKSITVELEWLKEFLGIPPGSYPLYGSLKLKILTSVKQDIDAKTDLQFNFEGKKTGRKVTRVEFCWKKNKKFQQMELPGMTEEGKSSIEEVLIYEFEVSPESLATKWVQEYGTEHVQDAIDASHEYLDRLIKKGQTIKTSRGGVVRKAIEQGWKPKKKSVIEAKMAEEQQKAIQTIEQTKIQKIITEKERERIEEERWEIAQDRFKNATKVEHRTILGAFREYLVELGNKTVINDFDQYGIEGDSFTLKNLFRVFLKNYYFSESET